MDAKALKERKGELFGRMKELGAKWEKRGDDAITAEEQENWTELNAAYDQVDGQLRTLTELAAVEKRHFESVDDAINAPTKSDPKPQRRTHYSADVAADRQRDVRMAIAAWARGQARGEFRGEEVRAAKAVGLFLGSNEIELSLYPDYETVKRSLRHYHDTMEWRADLDTGTATEGKELVATDFMREWELAGKAIGGLKSVCRVVRTTTGDDLSWPLGDDTGNPASIVGEESSISFADVATSDKVFGAYKYQAHQKVSQEFLEDNAVNFSSMIGGMLGTRHARGHNAHATTGDGSSKPAGFAHPTVGGNIVDLGAPPSPARLSADNIFEMFESLDPFYRQRAVWMAHDATISGIRQMVVTSDANAHLWIPDFTSGHNSDRILGLPVVVNQDMNTVGADNESIALGDFSRYVWREVNSIRVQRLDELYRANDQTAFTSFTRADGGILKPSSTASLVPIQVGAHSS